MKSQAFVIDIETELVRNGYSFERRDLPHGEQFRFVDGSILNAYPTGSAYWQGCCTDTCDEVDVIVKALRRKHRLPAGRQRRW